MAARVFLWWKIVVFNADPYTNRSLKTMILIWFEAKWSGLYSPLPPSTLWMDTLYHGKTDGRVNILQRSITERPWNSLGALFKWTCDYTGKKMPVFIQAVSGPFLCRGLVTFQLWPVWTTIGQAAQSAPCPPITPTTVLFVFLISCLIHKWVSRLFKLLWLIGLTQHGSKWRQIIASIALNYEAPFCGTCNKAVKPIWSSFTTGQMMIHYAPSAASFGTLALYDGRHPPTHSFSFFSFSPLFPSWGGLVFVAPSLWPTRVNESHVFDGGEQSQSRDTAMEAFLLQEAIFNSGRGKQTAVSHSFLVTFFALLLAPSRICGHTADSSRSGR